MTVVRPNSIAGINSITVQSGQALNIHDASGNLIRNITSSTGISTFASINVTQGSGDLIVGISTLVVDNSAGKIGIGTVPARTFQVFAATPQVNLKSASGGNCELQFGDTGDEVRANIIYNSSSNYLGFNGYNNTERMRIDSSGQLVIGSTSGEAILDVTGGVSISSNGVTVTPSGYDLKIRSNTSKLGIHCDSGSGTPTLEFGTGGSTGCFINDLDATPMRFGTHNTERMRIRGDGRISIGSSLAVTGVCTAAQFLPTECQIANRNLVINGDMQVSQRGTQVTGLTGSAYATVDRFKFIGANGGTYTCDTVADSVDQGPNGLRKAFKFTCTTADNAGQSNLANADGLIGCEYRFEGQDVQRIQKGYSSAKQVTLSFWVKSNLTGTYNVELKDVDNTRNCGFNYTVSSSGTWEKKTIIFPADTTGTMGNDSGQSLTIQWWLAAGNNYRTGGSAQTTWGSTTKNKRAYNNVNLSTATSKYWQITGVQLEVGPVATPFEFQSYGDALLKCQRYYYRETIANNDFYTGMGMADIDGNSVILNIPFPVTMRQEPSLETTGDATDYMIRRSTTQQCTAVPTIGGASTPHQGALVFTKSSHGWGDGSAVRCGAWGTSYLGFNAEL